MVMGLWVCMESIYDELGGGHGIGGVLQRVSLYMEKILVIVCGIFESIGYGRKKAECV